MLIVNDDLPSVVASSLRSRFFLLLILFCLSLSFVSSFSASLCEERERLLAGRK